MKVIINISLKNGVLDPEGQAIKNSLLNLGFKDFNNIRIGKQIILDIDKINKSEVLEEANNMCETILANTVIENYKIDILEGK
ncbi:phosphoribosylformylglycinamidine synthase subunit PurS [Alphaproteobacteria bacterium]|jgi:phosphoribosylformylglycinamidine synthase PurS subunit|nr:phosphoribosylformylglycinamidine synthase subunit PurS [Alphaproteobacteria bacterium]MDB9872015.1 phosphoribosylformylglycinamidine synthase subunit PurS [Alphaproteobacteria bacterium]|tara:strand:+ start:2255 stop:2503 length:249 start_codon:yes stop_codon:yes gene_type:complete